ncbi:FmdE family protein [Sporomusa sphaeroides]|jgi:formylmethanofuran dehydrogenase subunit E|uniref:FmdE, Molybdenum formylmethanofuran dehydrogenase operon n=1 Tax=Sporomusa sphaeroides DSM 2875 TaxID=1337886 RepID=A0ABM9W086_9FIRM|nr:FmdE family protein [Sporomusa sphaeroides]OLS57080.1 FmdE, molybdenum formylmethanofuran dehydrogenase operon [Sporomusa sphaeroides DSM 2875]CVK18266.1 FmdE, Molybdenum formylmethanofuran dehydrogenase operon [Sporomusa sphaeroides DSM 2875]
MNNHPADYQKAIEFHGHCCPGLTIGYLAAKAALAQLKVERAADEELVAIVESDGCGIDAIQVLLGCTIGKGNLIYKDYGKQAYTIGNRSTGEAVRIVVMAGSMVPLTAEQEAIKSAVFSGQATPEQEECWRRLQSERTGRLLAAPAEDLFKIQKVELKLPAEAKIFNSVICEYCGEKVMESRARLQNGKIACLACTEEYSRGW